jgi:hypothetical protein
VSTRCLRALCLLLIARCRVVGDRSRKTYSLPPCLTPLDLLLAPSITGLSLVVGRCASTHLGFLQRLIARKDIGPCERDGQDVDVARPHQCFLFWLCFPPVVVIGSTYVSAAIGLLRSFLLSAVSCRSIFCSRDYLLRRTSVEAVPLKVFMRSLPPRRWRAYICCECFMSFLHSDLMFPLSRLVRFGSSGIGSPIYLVEHGPEQGTCKRPGRVGRTM